MSEPTPILDLVFNVIYTSMSHQALRVFELDLGELRCYPKVHS